MYHLSRADIGQIAVWADILSKNIGNENNWMALVSASADLTCGGCGSFGGEG